MNQADISFVWVYMAFVKGVVSFDWVMIFLFEIRQIFSGQKNHPNQEISGELDSLKIYIVPWIPKAKPPWISKSIFEVRIDTCMSVSYTHLTLPTKRIV